MSRRVKLYAGPVARLRYAATSNLARWAGIGAFVLVLVAAIVGSIPYVPAIYEQVSADITVAGEHVRDDMTVANTVTPSKEDAMSVELRIDAGQYVITSEKCIEEAGIKGQRSYDMTYALARLKELLTPIWVDPNAIAEAQTNLTDAWRSFGDEKTWAFPSCSVIHTMTTA